MDPATINRLGQIRQQEILVEATGDQREPLRLIHWSFADLIGNIWQKLRKVELPESPEMLREATEQCVPEC